MVKKRISRSGSKVTKRRRSSKKRGGNALTFDARPAAFTSGLAKRAAITKLKKKHALERKELKMDQMHEMKLYRKIPVIRA